LLLSIMFKQTYQSNWLFTGYADDSMSHDVYSVFANPQKC